MADAPDSFPPNLDDFIQGFTTTPEAMALLRTEFDNAANKPIFFALCPHGFTPMILKPLPDPLPDSLLGPPSYEEICILHQGYPALEIEVTMFGLTLCGEYKSGGQGTRENLLIDKTSEIYGTVLRDKYTFQVPQHASDVMTLAFARQSLTITNLMETIMAHPSFSSLNLQRRVTLMVNCDAEKEEDKTESFWSDDESMNSDKKFEESDKVYAYEDFVDLFVLGPPTVKLSTIKSLDDIEWKTGRPMKRRNHRVRPRDELFDINQNRLRNWQGHFIFDENSVTLMKGYLRFRVLDGNVLEPFFVANSMRKVAGNGHRWGV
ncbi:hypothetical protein BJ165DRAFT_1534594 [Panaeolus papilionaceus]|nr:hypothetical protein BJ165DRAFT_1534594 [Panaeolus papilionaceus]